MAAERDTVAALRQEFLWRFASREVASTDFAWAEARIEPLSRISVRNMADSLPYVWNELVPNVDALAKRNPVLGPLAEALRTATEHLARNNARVLAAQDELLGALAEADVWPVVIKGTAMRAYSPYPQAMNDLDVVTRDLDQTWQVLLVAQELGYPINRIKLVRVGDAVPGAARYHGYTNLYRLDGGGQYIQGDWDLGRVRTLDVHIARFYGCGHAVLTTDLFARARRASIADRPLLVPAPEDMILVELVHMLRHGTVTARVVNRVAEILGCVPELDLDYLVTQVRRNDLPLAAHAVLRAVDDRAPQCRADTGRIRHALGRSGPPARALAGYLSGQRRVEKYGAGTVGSVLAQGHYLFHAYRHQYGATAPILRAGAGFVRMLNDRKVYPRAYHRWNERRTGWLDGNTDAVMLVRIDSRSWAGGSARVLEGRAEPIGRDATLLDKGRATEALLTPIGTLTAATYNGDVPPRDAEAVMKHVDALRQRIEA